MHNYNHTLLTERQKLTLLLRRSPERPGGPALQTIGNLAKTIMPTPSAKDSQTPKSPQTLPSGANTGAAPNPATRSKPTGQQLTASTSQNGPPASLPAALAASDPQATLAAIKASLPPQIRSSLKPVYDEREELVRYQLTTSATALEINQARTILERSLMPLNGEECLNLLKELKVLTRPTPGTTDDLELQLVAYLKRLMDYPGDVVRHVLTTHPKFSPWWPAWQDLHERLELHTYRRRKMLEGLKATPISRPSSIAATSSTAPAIDPATMAQAQKIVADRAARKAASLAEPDISPEEFERQRLQMLELCGEKIA
jgi:hypothetical protein